MNTTNYEVIELNSTENQLINGGTRLSYAIGYICGSIVKACEQVQGSAEQAAVTQALQDFH